MQIPSEYLKEQNYEGSRLVEIKDKAVLKLKAELEKFKPKMLPHLKELEEVAQILDPYYTQIRDFQGKIDEIKKDMQPIKDRYDAALKIMEAFEQKTDAIKNKIQPIIAKIMKPQLAEFETSRQLIEKDGKLFVEVIDEIEEKVKAIRQVKQNNV